jgi:hypothetical protein
LATTGSGECGWSAEDDYQVISHPDVPAVEKKKLTVADLACKIATAAFRV